jgi:hypothetical protein
MIDQTIAVSASEVENTHPRLITELSGADISTAPVQVSLGSYDAPGTWVTPDVLTRGTIAASDFLAANPGTELPIDPNTGQPVAGSVLLHWVVVELTIGDALKPAPGHYWLHTNINNELRRSPGRITIT